jgi:hypothetical protein
MDLKQYLYKEFIFKLYKDNKFSITNYKTKIKTFSKWSDYLKLLKTKSRSFKNIIKELYKSGDFNHLK